MNKLEEEDMEEISNEEIQRKKMLSSGHMKESRLGFPFALQLPLAVTVGFLAGAALGIGHGTTMSAMRFRAENAHRLPTTPTGWYLYHKTKNYVSVFGGVKEGGKMGLKVGTWTGAFFAVENIFDRWRGEYDFLNTVGSSLAISGAFSWWNLFPLHTAARTVKVALCTGLAYGLTQDALRFAQGKRVGYLDFISGRVSDARREKVSESLPEV
ncbi:hypothetical protein K3495_g8385 [Podosphaera aphanis]|nr:hypothetical protein K3495_g8385 [Podosphaera aphanis]